MPMKSAITAVGAVLLAVAGLIGYQIGYQPPQEGQSPPTFLGGEPQFSIASTTQTVIGAGVGAEVVGPNSARQYAIITNTSGTIAYLAFTGTSTPSSVADSEYVVPLAASGGSYEIGPDNPYTGQIFATSSSAVTIRALESDIVNF